MIVRSIYKDEFCQKITKFARKLKEKVGEFMFEKIYFLKDFLLAKIYLKYPDVSSSKHVETIKIIIEKFDEFLQVYLKHLEVFIFFLFSKSFIKHNMYILKDLRC